MRTVRLPYNNALVTGASSGIGQAIATRLCEQGITVFALARSRSRLNAIRNSLSPDAKPLFKSVVCDLMDDGSIKAAVDQLSDSRIDLLVNNAGTGIYKKFELMSEDEIDKVLNTNLKGTLTLTSHILRRRAPNESLHLVFVTSLAGKIGFSDLSVYSASKFALEGFCETLRAEYEGSPVSITVLRPGVTDTAFFEKAGMQAYKETAKNLRSFYSPDKVAEIFLQNISRKPPAIIVGNDKYFLIALPFIPFRHRLKALDIINKL